MITGAHSVIFSKDAEADRAFLRDELGLSGIDAGEGWLIFALPPAEVAVHPSRRNDVHEFYLMANDIRRLAASLKRRGVACSPVEDRGWGLLTRVTLPGGGSLGIYQARHARPRARGGRKRARK